jgi:hypothetical protein
VGFLPSPANGCLFPFFCRYVGNPFPLYHSGNYFCGDFCSLLLHRSLSGDLEMSAMWAIIFQGSVFPEPVRGPMLPLRASKMGRVGERNSYSNATISVSLEGRASKKFLVN